MIVAGLLLLAVLGLSPGEPQMVRLTWYDQGTVTASGEAPYWGGAACSYHYPLGTAFALDGEAFRCNDRGGGINGEPWLDVYCITGDQARWVAAHGPYALVEVLRDDDGFPHSR